MNRRIRFILQLDKFDRQMSSVTKHGTTYYEVLGVSHAATSGDIKAAYYEKTKLYHPDVVPPTEENLRAFRLISEAYEILGSDITRKQYDENVIGITNQNARAEDPIAEYKRRIKNNTVIQSWARDYCEHLRKQQSSSSFSSRRIENESEFKHVIVLVLPLLAVAVLMAVAIGKYNLLHPHKIKQSRQ